MVVDTVLRHRISVVVEAEGEAVPEGFGWDVQHMAAYLYVDDGLLASKWVAKIYRVYNVLTEIFDRFGLRTNVSKTVSMACQLYFTI